MVEQIHIKTNYIIITLERKSSIRGANIYGLAVAFELLESQMENRKLFNSIELKTECDNRVYKFLKEKKDHK